MIFDPRPRHGPDAALLTKRFVGRAGDVNHIALVHLGEGGGNTLYYLHTDHLGSTVLVTDRAGNQVETRQYYAYGRPRGGGTLPTDFTFTGQ